MCMNVSYLSILCSLLGVIPLPLSVNVRQWWPASSSTSIQICLADTPGSEALSKARKEENTFSPDVCNSWPVYLGHVLCSFFFATYEKLAYFPNSSVISWNKCKG